MKKIILLLSILINHNFSFSQVISDKINDQMIIKNKVKSITYYDTQNSISFSALYDRSGHLVKFSQTPFILGEKSAMIRVYEYEDTLISKSILYWMNGDSIIRNDTSYYEYDKNHRLAFILEKDNQNKSEMLTEFVYRNSRFNITKNTGNISDNLVQEKRDYAMMDDTVSGGNRVMMHRQQKKYMLTNYDIFQYSASDYKLNSISHYAYDDYPGSSKSGTYNLLEYEKMFTLGDTIIEKIGYSAIPKFDFSFDSVFLVLNKIGSLKDIDVKYICVTNLKDGKPFHFYSKSFGNIMSGLARSGTDDYEYFANGLIKRCIGVRHRDDNRNKDIHFEEIYNYTYY